MSFRDVTGYALEPIQQSMVSLPSDNQHLGFLHMELGVIISVQVADSSQNMSAMQSQVRRGWQHECVVQVVSSGRGGDYRLANVVIPPTRPSGMDNYVEALPRPSTKSVAGEEFDPSLQRMSAYDLDGDWCVVGFLNGDQDQPFIVSWWPNPNNKTDPQTGGDGSPDSQGEGKTLNQTNRFFSRTNGVEVNITPKGDVYFNTNFAGTSPDFVATTEEGRYKRDPGETGGNIRVDIKPSATLEMDWTKPKNGLGTTDQPDDFLTQTNPKNDSNNNSSSQRENTYLKVSKNVLELFCTDISIDSDSCIIAADTGIQIQSSDVEIGATGGSVKVLGKEIVLGDGPDSGYAIMAYPHPDEFFSLKLLAVNTAPGSTVSNAAAIVAIQTLLRELFSAEYTKVS